MKPLLFPILAVLFAVWPCLAQVASHTQQHTVAILVDTSPTSHDKELRWAALTFYRNCAAGDQVLLFVVRGKSTRLMFSCTKTLKESEFGDIAAIINDIDHDWFAHADLSAALSGPIYQQLRQRCSQIEPAIVAVISTANFSDEQAGDICKFARNIKENNNWALVITGLVDKTPRRIFLSATSGDLYWRSINDAIYGTMVDKWLKDIKRELADKPSPSTSLPDLLSNTIKQIEPNYPAVSKPGDNEANIIIMTPYKVGIAKTQNPPSKTDIVTPTPQERPAAKAEKSEPTIVIALSPASSDTNFQKDRVPAGIAKNAQKEPPPAAAASPIAEPNTSVSKHLHADAQTKTPAAAKPPAQIAAGRNVSHRRPSGVQNKVSNIGANAVPWKEFIAPLLAIAGGVIASIILLMAWRSWNRARVWKKTAKQRIDAFTNKPRYRCETLMAQVGEVVYRLGNLQRFRRVYVGNSAKNAVRIDRKGIIDRHLKIYRRFSSLRLKNLSNKPVMVTGHLLAASKKNKILLPAEITVCDGVMIRLFVDKTEITKAAQLQETTNGTGK